MVVDVVLHCIVGVFYCWFFLMKIFFNLGVGVFSNFNWFILTIQATNADLLMMKVFCLSDSVSIYANIYIYNVAQNLKENLFLKMV